ncbi:MAG: hypothetical protein Q8R60_15050 [Mycobacteriales bacterium]|nr:hypothetical protein [Mycobacteriales bacterium]
MGGGILDGFNVNRHKPGDSLHDPRELIPLSATLLAAHEFAEFLEVDLGEFPWFYLGAQELDAKERFTNVRTPFRDVGDVSGCEARQACIGACEPGEALFRMVLVSLSRSTERR